MHLFKLWLLTQTGVVTFLFYFPSVIFGSFSQESHITLVVLKYISYLLWYMSMCVNPWIYVWKSKDFRRAFVKLLHLKHVKMVDPNGVSSYSARA